MSKTFTLIVLFAAFTISSCVKEYTCHCIDYSGDRSYTEPKSSQKAADKWCDGMKTSDSSVCTATKTL